MKGFYGGKMEQKQLPDKPPILGGNLSAKKFFDSEGASFKGFIEFCKSNIPLVITLTLAALFVYGVALFNIALTGDNIIYLFDPDTYKMWHIGVGRWASRLLASLFFIKESGIYASNFIAVFSIWLFSMLFCYFIAVFTKNTGRRNGFIPLALTVLSYSVWAQYFSFFYQNKIQAAFICVTLIAVYLVFDGFLSHSKMKIMLCFVLSLFSFCIYQPFIPLFLCIVFVFFVLLQENSNYSSKEYSFLCLKLAVFFIAAFAAAALMNGFLKRAYDINMSGVERVMIWNKSGILSVFANILAQGYTLTIGYIPFVHSIFSPMMADMYGSALDPFGRPVADIIFNNSRAIGNVILLPFSIAFLALVFINAKKKIPAGRRLLYILAGFGIPFSILFLVFVSGEVIGTRILYALPFAAAFMFYYVSHRQKTVLRRALYCVILATVFYQAQISQIMLESAARVGDIDTKIAFDLDNRIREVLDETGKLPVVYVGNIEHPLKKQRFTIEMAGRSSFEWWTPGDISNQTLFHVIPFMDILGFNYDVPTPEQMQKAYEASLNMPAYPDEGCVKNIGDVVVVKMGD
jgi:hypothetical protein